MNNADDIPQRERRKVMENDRKVMATYHSHAQSSIDDERGGRYATEGSKQTVIGSSPIAYPQQPSTSPWHSDPCPPEPPLGYSVEEMEPTGEMFEREAPVISRQGAKGGGPTQAVPKSKSRPAFHRRI